MFRSGIIGLAALGLITLATSAQAKMDCGATYKDFLAQYHTGKAASHPADKVADINRRALHAYEAPRAMSSMPQTCSPLSVKKAPNNRAGLPVVGEPASSDGWEHGRFLTHSRCHGGWRP